MADLHPETIATIRRERPDLDDLPDEALAKLWLTHWASSHLYVRDLGRALLATPPGRFLDRTAGWLTRKLGGRDA